ncbi:MAG: glutamate--tRNA ligase [Oscillospiraceae bacterium]
MASNIVRTRFAPSPTGYMHVGNLRTALYAYLKARSADGTFILRIEDTDQERLVDGAVDIIYNTLRETGLTWDEGPDIGGDYGPYVQSERMGIFKGYAQQLVENGSAYYCFCEKERLEEMRAVQKASGQAPHYDGHCRNLSEAEVKAKLDAGAPYVIRQKMPREGKAGFDDVVYGYIEVDASELDDQILIKADGMPTYNFANVVDDHLMGITHVIRGSEYLSSTPKYNLLYQAFGWEIPTYIHCPPVMKDSQNKLSKRNGDASYQDLVAAGYLTEAILNYILLLGWSPKGEKEIFSLSEMIEVFDESGIGKAPAIFDVQKLRYINAEYIRALSPEAFYEKAKPYMDTVVKTDCDRALLSNVLQQRCEVLSDIPEQIDFIDELPDYDLAMYENKKMKTNKETSKQALTDILPVLEGIESFTKDNIHTALFALIETLGVKNGIVLWPLRVAVSGKQFTPGGGIELAAIIGKEKTIARVKHAIELL